MALVKLHPYCSLYALRHNGVSEGSGTRWEIAYVPVLDVHRAFCVGVTKVTRMRRAKMDLAFVQRISDLVWEDTSGKA